MGGCGGDPGSGGNGGGASVGLLSWQSAVTLEACSLDRQLWRCGWERRYGAMAVGRKGRRGRRSADSSGTVGTGGEGGKGGNGGTGGNGAGGTGGPSIALVYDGAAPTQVGAVVLNFSSSAAPGGKGERSAFRRTTVPDGAKGLTQDIYPKPTTL